MDELKPATSSASNMAARTVATHSGPDSTIDVDGGRAARYHSASVDVMADWNWTMTYLKANGDRAVMFALLGFAVGAVLLLVFLIVRLLVGRQQVVKKSSSSSSSSSSTIERRQQSTVTSRPDKTESVALLSQSVSGSPPATASVGSITSDASLGRQRRRPDKVHFASPPSDAELEDAAAGRSRGISDTDDTVVSPTSTATSLNDVFLPSSTPIVGAGQSQQQSTINRLWQTSFDVADGGDDETFGTLLRNDTSRGSFYSNPFRHDTIDGRIRTSRAK